MKVSHRWHCTRRDPGRARQKTPQSWRPTLTTLKLASDMIEGGGVCAAGGRHKIVDGCKVSLAPGDAAKEWLAPLQSFVSALASAVHGALPLWPGPPIPAG
jgi:hypothetical protein